jgi:nitrogen PTS system EIIA component
MQITELLIPGRMHLDAGIGSKKRALEILGELLASDDSTEAELSPNLVFDSLSAREKLGSTGLGHGVAIPHGRMTELDTPRIALLRLDEGVDFDAIDHEPVDILIALIVPEDATSAHLDLLAQLARGLSQPDNIASLRRAADTPALYQAALRAFRDA